MTYKLHKVLTIAGSDSCCGAGVQADIKVITALGAYGTCAITALTAQNTLGVTSVFTVPALFVSKQIDAVLTDIGTDSLKTGMLVSEEVVAAVCDMFRKHRLKNLVVDPVMTSHTGERLLSVEGVRKLISDLIPLSYLVTPNIPEAEILTDCKIKNLDGMQEAAIILHKQGASNILVKGGHMINHENNHDHGECGEITDLFYDGKRFQYFRDKCIHIEKVHGTGCMYSAAIATGLAKGNDLISAITTSRNFITKIIKESSLPGKGSRLAHFTENT